MRQCFQSRNHAPKFFFIMHQNFSTQQYAGRCTEILAQSIHYAGHADSNMDFFQSAPPPLMPIPNAQVII